MGSRVVSFTAGLGAWALVACGPPDLAGTVRAEVVAVVGPDSQHALTVESIERLESLRALRGRDVDFRAGAVVHQDAAGALGADLGAPFSLDYVVDAEGVVRCTSLTSLSALSVYRHLDVSAEYLRQQGYRPSRRLSVFYSPNVDSALLGDLRGLFIDNAGYAAAFHAYLVMPSLFLQELPLSMNLGVVAHEYGHAVQQQLVLKDSPQNHADHLEFASANEGVADLIGFVVSGDPNFIAPSAGVDRDLAAPRDYTAADAEELQRNESRSGQPADPHRHGSLMARAVYEMWPTRQRGVFSDAERAELAQAILRTLGRLEFTGNFRLTTFPDALLQEVPPAHLPEACRVLRRRLAPLADGLTRCRGVGP